MSRTERILCVERNALPQVWLGEMTVTSMTESDFYNQIPASAIHFIPRPQAENDPAFKQIIPIC